MHRAAAVILLMAAGAAHAHPGHVAEWLHLHGFSPEMIVLVLLFAAWAMLRSR